MSQSPSFLTFSNDQCIKAISQSGSIRAVALRATELVQYLSDLHGYSGNKTKALGEAVMGALMIAAYCKPGERINLNIRTESGLVQQALVDAYPDGVARGYVITREGGSTDSTLWGSEGLLAVLRTRLLEKEQPYIGTVPLLTGHLAKDLTFYWVQSEQVPTAIGLVVNLKEDGKIAQAMGFMVQAMPGATQQEVAGLEQYVSEISNFDQEAARNSDPMLLLAQLLQGGFFMKLDEHPLGFRCECSMDKVKNALVLVGSEELSGLLKEQNGAEVGCDFCSKRYRINAKELQELITRASAKT